MAKFKGKNFLLKMGDGGSPSEVFTTVGNLRTTGLAFNNEIIDVTDKDGMPWRALIAGGVQSMDLSFAGVFSDNAQLELLLEAALAGTLHNFQLTSDNGDTFTGSFLIQSFERTGEYNGAEMYSGKLVSNGTITYDDN
jgi:TP901-1 family phage major tail protein